jgi:hypothetical protein
MNRNIRKGLFVLLFAYLLFGCGKDFWHPEGPESAKNSLAGTRWESSGSDGYSSFYQYFVFISSSTGYYNDGGYSYNFTYQYDGATLTFLTFEIFGYKDTISINGNSFYWNGMPFYRQ